MDDSERRIDWISALTVLLRDFGKLASSVVSHVVRAATDADGRPRRLSARPVPPIIDSVAPGSGRRRCDTVRLRDSRAGPQLRGAFLPRICVPVLRPNVPSRAGPERPT
jgi:hypothetical protein